MCAAKLEAAAQAAAGPKNQALEELFEGEFLPVYGQVVAQAIKQFYRVPFEKIL